MIEPPPSSLPQVSVIIPARNEEVNLKSCLDSLIPQSGLSFEIIVVDDHSTDRTREIAESYSAVRVLEAGSLPAGWTGKNNAVSTGARAATGSWLLFTDADTVHLPGSLARALEEVKDHQAALLSYSPEQIAVTFWELAVLPVVFAELARQYPPQKVSDPTSPEAAANGQYLLISREAYDAAGGHAAVAGNILEDVALARLVKTAGKKIRFRYAADAVRTRMYRNYRQLREGWTKNLAILFPRPVRLAALSFAVWVLPILFACVTLAVGQHFGIYCAFAALILFAFAIFRTARANFGFSKTVLAVFFGLPMFAYLLLRSSRAHARGNVSWKGRMYDPKPDSALRESRISTGKLA